MANEVRDDTPANTPDHRTDDDHDDPTPTPERLAEIEATENAEAVRRLSDLRKGRVQSISWEEAQASIFAPPTAEELAALPP